MNRRSSNSTTEAARGAPSKPTLPQRYSDCTLPSLSPAIASRTGTPTPTQQQEEADAALYKDMRDALADFEALQQQQQVSCSAGTNSSSLQRLPPRQTAFYAAMRSVLAQVLAETTAAGRHARLLAAHAWFVGHKPRGSALSCEPNLAAALAASLSISSEPSATATTTTAGTASRSSKDSRGSSKSGISGACSQGRCHQEGQDLGQGQHSMQQGALCEECQDNPCSCFKGPRPRSGPWGRAWATASHVDGSIRRPGQELLDAPLPAATNSSNGGACGSATALTAAAGPLCSSKSRTPVSSIVERLDANSCDACHVDWTPRGTNLLKFDGSTSSSSSNRRNHRDNTTEVPGLIPVGCLPSSRFTPAAAAAAAAAAGCRPVGSSNKDNDSSSGSNSSRRQQDSQKVVQAASSVSFSSGATAAQLHSAKAALAVVSARQAALEADVVVHMHGFARQQARMEEESSRRQVLAAMTAAMAATAAAAGDAAGSGNRSLLHVDSQHQPSAVSAVLGPTDWQFASSMGVQEAAEGGDGTKASRGAVPLVEVDKVKAARRQYQQQGQQECAVLQEQYGLPSGRLQHALLPLPDVPYMTAIAKLPPSYQKSKKHKLRSSSKKKKKNKGDGKKKSSSKSR